MWNADGGEPRARAVDGVERIVAPDRLYWVSAHRVGRPEDLAAYAERGRALALPSFGLPREALSLRFAAFTWGVDSAVAGTSRLAHLTALARHVEEGPLPDGVLGVLRRAWSERAAGWPGLI